MQKTTISSLALVRDELVATIEDSAKGLEQFIGDNSNAEALQSCVDGLTQITGTLKLIQLQGPYEFSDHILALGKELTPGADGVSEEALSVLTTSFFVLPRYLEYLETTKVDLPELLIPPINEIRALLNRPHLKESHYFSVQQIPRCLPVSNTSTLLGEDFSPVARRLRHMYQVGLLAVLQGKPPKSALAMMKRALERITTISGEYPLTLLWQTGAEGLQSLIESNAEIHKSRKLALSAIDRYLRKIQQEGMPALETKPPEDLVTEFVFWVAMSGDINAPKADFLSKFGVEKMPLTEEELHTQMEALKGPSAQTVQSVMAVLKEELNTSKDMLETSAQAGASEFGELLSALGKIAEILAVIGLTQHSQDLKSQMKVIQSWDGKAIESMDTKALTAVADTLLHVESAISRFETSGSFIQPTQAGQTAVQDIADTQLMEAENIVLKEAESGLALIKRALSSFVESNYDIGHIKNVSTILQTIRGGMTVLHLHRGAKVIVACERFVQDVLMTDDHPAVLQQLLETFADTIISLEYYIDAVKADREADDNILQIAEESLIALGISP
ncbi:pilus assembly protein [Marinibactrum halimedae]|uniref:Scaffold protein FimL second domain-containing protein n=1 Tax=Marinibactrum halimedae TaxID=1444977 RepID=A0AA37WNK7_9GAMM|nr:pilus assembly protein [Marinibactrum halimedae]MCD9459475.1 pilus assembly protein [Marinibactrum halimedae]GLS28129.1 hypothetical protein GCM10007877_38480 [Marinibactrum halimedae]